MLNDAELTARYAVGWGGFSSAQLDRAKVSCGSKVSAYDAALIARKALGQIQTFPKEGVCQ